MATAFTLFPLLPADIRFLIWEQTFLPRILSFTYDDEHNTDYNEWPEDWDEVAFNRLFALPASTVQPEFDLPGPLSGIVTESIPALEICRESREFAIKAGYREWTQVVPSGRMTFMWNPLYDTVLLAEFYDSQKRQPLFVLTDTFCDQFPEQARELRYIAVPTSLWNSEEGESVNEMMVEKWMRFGSLREIAAIVDENYENYRSQMHAHTFPEDKEIAKGCAFPDDIIEGLNEGKESSERWSTWRVPKVRVVGDEESILSTEDWHLQLRCDPCPDLKMFADEKIRRMREAYGARDWAQHRGSLDTLVAAQLFRDRFRAGKFMRLLFATRSTSLFILLIQLRHLM
ncbi:uncharacterized protein PAC_17571 [Phialocephala subalpina]|uniref:2EXR domain-containing protein n=1 Tax=Phialocephala subalpina TaxID=576137 RepID=A0A1L7XRJ5_9HELO|nr:uncharacterized protein PAC_17571 [Phialocephala subalpina]